MVVKFLIGMLSHLGVFPDSNFEVLSNVRVMLNNTFVDGV
jgi:hypothetical protein